MFSFETEIYFLNVYVEKKHGRLSKAKYWIMEVKAFHKIK